MDTQDEKSPTFSLKVFKVIFKNAARTMKIVWKEKKGTILLLFATLFVLSASPFLLSGSRGLLINELITSFGSGVFSSRIITLLLVLIVASFIQPLFRNLQMFYEKLLWFFMEQKFFGLLLHKKATLDVAIHEDPKFNNLLNRVNEFGVYRIQNFVDRQFFVFQNIFELIIALFILSFANWWLLIVVLMGTIPELVTEIKYGNNIWSIWGGKAEDRRKYARLYGHFTDLRSIIELKIFQNIGYFIGLVQELFASFQNEQKKAERKRIVSQLISGSLAQLTSAFALIWFVFEVVHGKLQVGTLTFFLASITDFRLSLSGLFQNLGQQYQDGLFVNDVFTLLDTKPVIQIPPKAIQLDQKKTPTIIFDNVSFAYPGAEVLSLKNISLTIVPGEKLAFVGANGAGKTTLVKLLCRFYDPTEGRILIDGYDLKNIDLESWYFHLGALFQDYQNYRFLVKEAIAFGRTGEKPSFEKVQLSARTAEADVFIEKWEQQYEQQLGKDFTGGVEPSIGQWQKLALARAFYREPRVLILDEPTSSIDAEAESKIFEKLEKLPKDRTVILISHRFSTVRQANRIAVIEGGELKELGTHQELLKENKTYARLFKMQAKGYQ